jgi:hypothetical protein
MAHAFSHHTFQMNPSEPAPTTGLGPALTWNPNFIWQPQDILDASLDPSLIFPPPDAGLGPAFTSSLFPTLGPASTTPIRSPSYQITPCRKGRNVDTLAIKEAASLLSSNPSRQPTPRRSKRNADSLATRSHRR